MTATKEEVIAFMKSEFPQSKCVVEAVSNGGATVSHHVGQDELRPGGTVSGPVLMSVAMWHFMWRYLVKLASCHWQ